MKAKLRAIVLCLGMAAATLGAGGVAAGEAPAAASTYAPTSLKAEPGVPRTSWGRPDFQGVTWNAAFLGLLEATPVTPSQLVLPEDKAKEAFDRLTKMVFGNPTIKAFLDADPEASALLENAAGFPIVRGERRTRLIVMPADGKLPYTAQARVQAQAAVLRALSMKADNPEDRNLSERCISLGAQPPIVGLNPLNPRQFVQTRTHVVIHTEYGDEVRIVPFANTHSQAKLPSTLGDSIARWEGDTLVIETTGFLARDRMRNAFPAALIVNPGARVIERYTRVSRDELLYQFTVEDPTVYTAPWLAEYSLYRSPNRMYPSSCHEGNYSLENILAGARQQEEAARAVAQDWTRAQNISDTTLDPKARWTISLTSPRDVRSWAVLAAKDASGQARVALRIEYVSATTVGGASALSEIDVFAVDCTGQRVQRLSQAAYAAHNLTGEKHEEAAAADWQPATSRPAIAPGIQLACSQAPSPGA
jgi:hypothetical protein